MNVDKFIQETLANKIEEAVAEIRKTILHPDNEPNVTLYPKTSIDQVEQLAEQLDYIKTNLIKDTLIGTNGITIDKAADSEKIEVSGKNLMRDPYSGVNNTGASIINYKRFGLANWGSAFVRNTHNLVNNANSDSIVGYDNGGVIYAKTTSDDPWSVVNKEYADGNYYRVTKGTDIPENADLNNYITEGTYQVPNDTVAKTIKNSPYIYAFKLIVERFSFYTVQRLQGQNSSDLWQRTNVGNAWKNWAQIANKKYVDDAIASISPTTQTKYQHNLVLEGTQLGGTIKAFMSIPRSDNTAFGTLNEIIAALGDAYISCTGYIYDGNQKSYAIVAFNTAGPGFEYNDPETGGQVFMVTNDTVTVTDNVLNF